MMRQETVKYSKVSNIFHEIIKYFFDTTNYSPSLCSASEPWLDSGVFWDLLTTPLTKALLRPRERPTMACILALTSRQVASTSRAAAHPDPHYGNVASKTSLPSHYFRPWSNVRSPRIRVVMIVAVNFLVPPLDLFRLLATAAIVSYRASNLASFYWRL